MSNLFKKELGKRIVFGTLMLAAVSTALFWRFPVLLGVLLLIVAIFLSIEYQALLLRSKRSARLDLLLAPNLLMLAFAWLMPSLSWFLLSLLILIVVCAILFYLQRKKINFIGLYFLNYLWLGLPIACLLGLRFFDNAQVLMLYVILVVAACDINAYFGGKAVGKHKLAPNISPNKTIEGLLIGIFSSVLVSLIISYAWKILSLTEATLLGASLALISQTGDLLESYFKRLAGVKNSSNFIPGHGGFLDRLDSLLTASILFFCYVLVKKLILIL